MMSRKALWVRSLLLGTLAAILYGVIHDQITIRISPPYLMDWHPEIVPSRDPTVVAFAWGVVATWWFGLILGIVLAVSATLGRRPPAPWRWIVRAVGGVFAVSAIAAAVAGGIVRGFGLELPQEFLDRVPAALPSRESRIAFTQAAAMHESSYDAAAVATLVAAGLIVWGRRRPTPHPCPSPFDEPQGERASNA